MIYAKKGKLKFFHLNGISANFCCSIIGDLSPLLPEPVTYVCMYCIHECMYMHVLCMHVCMTLYVCVCIYHTYIHDICMHSINFFYKITLFNSFKCYDEGPASP